METNEPPTQLTKVKTGDLPAESVQAIDAFKTWCTRHERGEGLPSRGRNYAALVVLNRLRNEYNLDTDAHKTESGKQVARQTSHHVSNLLQEFGEEREPLSEAGRTSRGSLEAAEDLLHLLSETGLGTIDPEHRRQVLTHMMEHCAWVEYQYHERKRIEFDFNPIEDPNRVITRILQEAGDRKKGAVAQHLVGAKLEIRLPEKDIPNHPATAADVQTDRRGDFDIGDTVFHVTVAPSDSVYQKCMSDLRNGLNVYLLVQDSVRSGTEQIAHEQHDKDIRVQSIENFVGQNLDEMSGFSREPFHNNLRDLIQIYNRRVDQVEANNSLKIELPDKLEDPPGLEAPPQ